MGPSLIGQGRSASISTDGCISFVLLFPPTHEVLRSHKNHKIQIPLFGLSIRAIMKSGIHLTYLARREIRAQLLLSREIAIYSKINSRIRLFKLGVH